MYVALTKNSCVLFLWEVASSNAFNGIKTKYGSIGIPWRYMRNRSTAGSIVMLLCLFELHSWGKN